VSKGKEGEITAEEHMIIVDERERRS